MTEREEIERLKLCHIPIVAALEKATEELSALRKELEESKQRVAELETTLRVVYNYLKPRVSNSGVEGRTVILPVIERTLNV